LDPKEYELIYQVEQSHWWYRGMELLTRSVLNRWYQHGKSLQILDAGCGTGAGMATYLAEYGTVSGFDLSPVALKFCRTKSCQRLTQASVENVPFASRVFDLITSFDVLYEQSVKNDAAALAEFARVLKPGGRLLLRLPAYDWLRGQHDLVIHTARRYTTQQVAGLLRQSGFVVQHLTYANTFLFPLALAKRLAEKIHPPQVPQSDLKLKSGLFNSLFRLLLSAEAPFVSQQGLPFGLSVIAVGQKKID
jgi:ubiquinone/menaquinone biosynthesis C-methylase UbiE